MLGRLSAHWFLVYAIFWENYEHWKASIWYMVICSLKVYNIFWRNYELWKASIWYIMICSFNTLRPRQNGRHFADDILKCIFLNENVWISINISMRFVPSGPINNVPTFVQVMAWRRPGDNPLSEPMMVRLPTHICVTRWMVYTKDYCLDFHWIDFITRGQFWPSGIVVACFCPSVRQSVRPSDRHQVCPHDNSSTI